MFIAPPASPAPIASSIEPWDASHTRFVTPSRPTPIFPSCACWCGLAADSTSSPSASFSGCSGLEPIHNPLSFPGSANHVRKFAKPCAPASACSTSNPRRNSKSSPPKHLAREAARPRPSASIPTLRPEDTRTSPPAITVTNLASIGKMRFRYICSTGIPAGSSGAASARISARRF